MEDKAEGSKAMNAYIVICFVLAAGALVAYKITNDKRTELSAEYLTLSQKVADMQGGLAPNIADYYNKVKSGQIVKIGKTVKDDTHLTLKAIAESPELGIKESAGPDDRLDVVTEQRKLQFKEYYEHGCVVTLKNVTQTEWAAYLRKVMDPLSDKYVLHKYVMVDSIDIKRKEQRFNKLEISAEVGGRYVDRSLWDVTIRFVWFSTLAESDAS